MKLTFVRRTLTGLGTITARPEAFLIVVAYGGLWLALEPDTFDMHGVATLVVWIMTLLIQRAEHRDTQALHAKLDGLIKATGNAETGLTAIDRKEPEEIEALRDHDRPA